ncbi:hypothetical protein V8E54_013662 [Elaphomyces granulatus]
MTAAERQLTEKELLEKGVYSSLQHRLRRHLLQQLLMLLVLPSLLRYLIRPVHIAAVLDNPHVLPSLLRYLITLAHVAIVIGNPHDIRPVTPAAQRMLKDGRPKKLLLHLIFRISRLQYRFRPAAVVGTLHDIRPVTYAARMMPNDEWLEKLVNWSIANNTVVILIRVLAGGTHEVRLMIQLWMECMLRIGKGNVDDVGDKLAAMRMMIKAEHHGYPNSVCVGMSGSMSISGSR